MRWDLLLIDADDTLFDFNLAEAESLRTACEKAGVCWNDETLPIYRSINEGLWLKYERGEISQDSLRSERTVRLLEQLRHKGDPGEFGALYTDALTKASHLMPGALDAVREIAAKIPIVIVTNGITSVQRGRLDASQLRPYIRAIVVSEEVGAAKPNPRIIHEALSKVGGVYPSRAIMVGDNIDTDVAAAKAAGVASCWFNPAHKPSSGRHTPDYEIDALERLPALLFDIGGPQ
ncbi:MAG: YjjG family noncanonical pyrimidine nucleotidase [Oscillospiraceae bacterium]|jgi:YjjG family noncanonical pyrimidine nucleotidase|nr:YjjG family noncanonical pyrimidine nucleotidase [Oscillospiraceae bacterium]